MIHSKNRHISIRAAFSLVCFLFLHTAQSLSQPMVHLETYASGLTRPVTITNAGDDRLFVVEQPGKIRILDSDGNLLLTPFLDIGSRVSYAGEKGLLGLAFHPDYSSNGLFYVNYTDVNGDTRISLFNVSEQDHQTADAESESLILKIDQPYSNHNGGDLKFGPDGFLYIATGDGGSGGDPLNLAQDTLSLLGKMLRINVNVADTYAVPVTNPYVGSDNPLDEIWAVGLRNPWRFSFDRSTGDLWIADVGQGAWEEINFQEASSNGGENYGWRCYEGNHAYNTSNCNDGATYTYPIHEYNHTSTGGCSVTGGYVYRGNAYPAMYGYYFFSDYCNDSLLSLHDSSGTWVLEHHDKYLDYSISTFGEDSGGELYAAGLYNGNIYRVKDSSLVDTVCQVYNTVYTVSDTNLTVKDTSYARSDTNFTFTDTLFTHSHTSISVTDTTFTIDDSTYIVTDSILYYSDTTFSIITTLYTIRDTAFTLIDSVFTVIDTTFTIVDSVCHMGGMMDSSSDTSYSVTDSMFNVSHSSYLASDTSYARHDTSFTVEDSVFHIIDTSVTFTGDTSNVGFLVPSKGTGIILYPVPTGRTLVIDAGWSELKSLIIRDIHGRVLLESPVSENPVHLNVEFLQPGIYILGIISENKQEFRRFLKE